MTPSAPLTDSQALSLHRARASAADLFLHQAAADDIIDRLSLVNNRFTDLAVISSFPSFWQNFFKSDLNLLPTETLPLENESHDLVVHAMALHWANDPVGQLIQCRRALRPDGLLMAVGFGGLTLHELRSALGQAEIEICGGLSPRVAPMAELRDMGGLLQRAGLALPVADVVSIDVAYRDIYHLMHDLRAMGETNALTSRLRHPTKRAVFERAGVLYRENFAAPQGGITATFELLFLAGWAPAASQPKALRPGSAAQRLADALHTTENPLPD